MTEIKITHSPGPWRIGRLQSYEMDGTPFRRVYMPADHSEIQEAHIRGDNCDGNARLIAAAPDMLAALKEAQRFLDYYVNDRTIFVGLGTPPKCLAQVESAIEKAEDTPDDQG